MKRFLIAGVVLLVAAATVSAQDIPLSKILVEKEDWRELAPKKLQNLLVDNATWVHLDFRYGFGGGPRLAAKDLPRITALRSEQGGKVLVWQGPYCVTIGPDDNLTKEPVAFGWPPTVHEDIVVGRDGAQYTLGYDEAKGLLIDWDKKREEVKLEGMIKPWCLTFWPDQSQLVVGDAGGNYLWTARTAKDGKLGKPDRYYSLRVKPGAKGSGVKAMVMDAGNLLYAATPLGVQAFDPTGRLCGVILPPTMEEMTAITIGGKDADALFVACGDKVYSRKIQGKAAYTLKKDK
jgi:hypothetical protein